MTKNKKISGKIGLAASQYGRESQYWLNKFSGELKKSSFPYDFSKEKTGQEEPGTLKFHWTGQHFETLTALSKGMDHRLYIILTAAVVVLLHKYTGSSDIIIGSPISRQEVEGDFINTVLALRNRLDDRASFKELLLKRVRPTIIEANEHQNYPIETLLFQLNMPFTQHQFPLFDVAVLLENIHEKKHIRHTQPNIVFSFLRTPDSIKGTVEYNSSLYERDTAVRILRHFNRLIEQVIIDIDLAVSRLDILGEDEREQLLVAFNDTRTDYPAERTVDELFEEQVARVPNETAVTYEGEPLTYKELNDEADRLAAHLCFIGVAREEPVAIMAENSFKVVAALLGILKAGGAYLPVNVQYPEERKKYILNDCNARVLLTNCPEACGHDLVSTVVHLEDSGIYQSTGHLHRDRGSDDLAYIMYTSGSTGTPKGVMVTHRNVARLVKNTNYVRFEEGESILLTGALEFDASTFEIWGALLNGLTLHLVHKDTILNPGMLKKALQGNGVSTIWMTAPLFNQMLDTDIEIFSGLKNLLVGGDVLSPVHINRVRDRFPRLTVINGYGPTENTTFSITHRVDKDYKKSIPIGKPISNSTAYILDNYSQPVPIGVPGELYVGGDGLSRGYLNNPELTAEKFIDFHRSYRSYNSYQTGDLARWLPDPAARGTYIIEFLGRIDHQVKIRGYRIEPGEIENYLVRIDFIEKAVVIDRKNRDGEKYLCAYIAAGKSPGGVDPGELKKILSNHFPDYMVPAYFVQLEEIPLTPNGKVDRRALPEPEAGAGGAAYAAPRNRVEEKMAEIWALVLGVDKELIGIDADFFEWGGHSLKATMLISKMHKAFDVKVPLAELFRTPTIRELAEFIDGLQRDKFLSIEAAEEREYYELSSAQKRLYILQQMELAVTTYNIPYVMVLEGELDRERLQDTFRKLINRHESLRTSFEMINGEPHQKIQYHVDFMIKYGDSSRGGPGEQIRNFVCPFDLAQAPLLRVELIKETGTKHILMVDIHHIITDGTSMELFVKEFMALYAGEELAPLPLQYKDFAQWQNSSRQREAIRQQEKYWLKQFEGEVPLLDLPADFPRPPVQSFAGSTLPFELSTDESSGLNRLASKEGVTLYMVLLAVYNIFLARITGQEDMVVGTPIAARRHADLERIIGMFVNTLALRNYPADEKMFTVFLREVKERTLAAFENQEYQFEDLVERLLINRDAGRNPLFDAAFSLENMEAQAGEIPEVEVPGLRLIPYDHETSTAKFDLTLTCVETGERLFCLFNYCTKLFREETVKRFAEYFKKVVRSVLDAPGARLSEIEIISREEKKRVLYDFNDTETGYPRDKTIHHLFREQVEQTPDYIALVGIRKMHVTYRELEKKSDRLAHLLVERGVEPNARDSIVGIMMERSLEMIIGIMGILKAGGAYLPIETGYPEERITYMLKDSGAKILLTNLPEGHHSFNCQLSMSSPKTSLHHSSFITHFSSNLAYVIYTSGTTGRPKGVMVEHKSLVNLCSWHYRSFALTENDKATQYASLSFDASVWEIFPYLVKGAALHILDEEIRLDIPALKEYFRKHGITVSFLPTQLCEQFVEEESEVPALRVLLTGGDKLNRYTVRSYEFYNNYGPTENTVVTTSCRVSDDSGIIPIGKPIANNRVYILNKESARLQPPGAPGELCISGDSLARGYLNNPELTNSKFQRGWHPQPIRNDKSPADEPTHPTHPLTHSPIYKTGDLARWLPDGGIEFLGRIDRQVKIRGFRIELGEIESRLLKQPGIKEAVVIDGKRASTDDRGQGDKYLCAYIVSEHPNDISGLRNTLSSQLPEYMIPSYFMQVKQIPLTPNGKVDRKALPEPEAPTGEAYAAPSNQTEERLTALWAEVLNIEKNKISIDADFFELGGHSLKATVLIAEIHKTFDVKIPLTEIFRLPTVRKLSQCIQTSVLERYSGIAAAENRDYYPLSSAQKRLYILQQMEPESTVYNMPYVVWLDMEVDKEKIEKTFKRLIHRHENLRTSFLVIDEEPVQRIHKDVVFELESHVAWSTEHGAWDKDSLHAPCSMPHASFVRPFDLSQAPLLRVGLIQLEEEKYIFMMDMHHIISDGVSQGIFVKEFMAVYNDSQVSLPPLRLQYKDYSQWQNRDERVESLIQQEQYWIGRFAGELPVLSLLYDYPRPAVQSFEGNHEVFSIGREETTALKALTVGEDATLYMGLLAVFNLLLSRLSGQEDIIIGSPIAGRRHADLQPIMGMFVNTLAMRNHPAGNKTVSSFLREVKKSCLEAFENQEYPFETLVERVSAARDVGRNPVFDVMFALQNLEELEEEPIDHIRPYEYESRIAKFDVTLVAAEREDTIAFSLEYCTRLFKEETIERFINYFKNIVSSIVEDHHQNICDVEMLREEEKRQILFDFNDTGEPYVNDKTIPQLFESQVEQKPDNIALIGSVRQHLTYKNLDQKSSQLAHHLLQRGVNKNEIVGLILDRSVEMIFGILGILKAGCAYVPLNPKAPAARSTFILEECSARILVSKNLEVTDLIKIGPIGPIGPIKNDLCYVIFTSGSTGQPKGVPISHANLCPLLHWGYRELGLGTKDRFLQNLSYYFDWSVWEILMAITTGAGLYMVPDDLLLNPEACIPFMNQHNITVLHITPTQYQYFVNVGRKPETLKYLFLGAEKLSRELVERSFESVNEDCRVFNMYGPTECTIISAVLEIERSDVKKFETLSSVPIGRPVGNIDLLVLDKYDNPQPIGVMGELYIGGDCVSRGYLNNPELTAERFNRSYKSHRTYTFYKTGDLARWLWDGPPGGGPSKIEFLGRVDSQVKIRGFRIELGEIESRLLTHDLVNEAVVIDREKEDDEKYLCAYIIPKEDFDLTELKEYLSRHLPDYMIPSYFMKIERIPLNPNGKLDRRALPVPDGQVGEEYVAPSDEIEEKLAVVWSEVLGVEKEKISVDANFFELGGHSLNATILIAKIHKAFDVKIPLTEIFRLPTVRTLSQCIKTSVLERYSGIAAVENRDYYPLSSAQKRLYILQQMEPESTVYNMPYVVWLDMAVDKEKIEITLKRLIHRHENLRTSFLVIDEEPVQRIHKGENSKLQITNYKAPAGHPITKMIRNFICPFDLSQAPLLRVGLIQLEEEKYIFMMDMHHIISDGVSQGIFVKEFMAIYNDSQVSLPPLRLQYKDYSQWQNRDEQVESLIQQEQYWIGRFAGELPVLNLPYDYPRPAVQSFEGTHKTFFLGKEETIALRTLAAEKNVTLYMGLLAVFTLLLSRLSGQEDIIIGSPIAGRHHADLQPIMGMFVNTLAMRNYPAGEKTVSSFLREVKQGSLEAFENQEYPFETLVEKVSAARDVGRNPVFDVMFALQNLEGPEEEPIDNIRPYEYESRIAKFDITLVAAEREDTITFSLEYCTRLFKEETIERFIDYFKNIVSSIVEDHHQKICAVEMLREEEKRHLLLDFNDTGGPYPNDQTIPQLFESQVEQTPDNIALIDSVGQHLTYRTYMTYKKLNKKSNQLAHRLCQRGVKKNEMVGLKLDRSVEMIIGILGILKAGCAYVPLNPKTPAARSKFILKECCARILVSENIEVIDSIKLGPIGPIKNDLCYVIFTSGSTGQPKGVPISHANLCHLLHWGYRELGLGTKDRFLQNLSYYFDWSVWEILMAITTGASLYMVPDDLLLNPEVCIPFMNRHNITVLHITPTQYQHFVNVGRKPETLKYLFLGAEKLSRELVERSFESVNEDCRVFNMYGPTECTIISAVLEIEWSDMKKFENLSSVPIGGPVGNIDLLVLDNYLNPCPVNAAGELYIAGDCVAQGYLNQPELTAEKFPPAGGPSHLTHPLTHSPLYRTGDLARWLPDGNIEFLGRMDHQVKIRGYRIELGEIESQLLTHAAVKEAVVLALESAAGEKYLCAYITAWSMEHGARREGTEAPTAAELEEYLSQFLPDYMIPSHFIPIAAIPLTPNGKLDRRALPVPETQEGEEYAAPANDIEETLTSLWSDLLNINKETIGVNANFFQLGGHSLKASMMTSMIHKAFDVKIPLVELFRQQTIRELAKLIKESKKDLFMDIEPVEKKEYYDISYNQEHMWEIYKREPETIAFNMPGTVTLKGSVDVQAVKQTLGRLTERHESLRIAFIEKNGKVFQRVKESVEIPLKQIDISHLEEEEKERRYREILANEHRVPFDLSRPPLFRTALVKRTEESWDFIYNLHHSINDGWSQQVLNEEFASLYQALQARREVQLEPLSLQYKDFVAWQKQVVSDTGFKDKSLRYWREKLGDGKPVLRLPTDVDGSAENRAGAGYYSMMGEHLKDCLSELAKQHNTSLAAVMFSTFLLLFSEFAKQEEIDSTLIHAGRDHVSMSRIMGYFVHRLFFKTRVEAGEPFTAYLSRINREVMEMFQYKSYPLEAVCEELEMERPYSAVAFNMHNFNDVSGERNLEPFEPYHLPDVQDIKFDIEMYVTEYRNGLRMYWAYRKSLFSAETAAYIAAEYNRITEYLARNTGMNLKDYRSSAEKQHGLPGSSRTWRMR